MKTFLEVKVKLVYEKPEHDALGEPISKRDSYWEVSLHDEAVYRAPFAYGTGKTKAAARSDLQNNLNIRLKASCNLYTQALRFVTMHKT